MTYDYLDIVGVLEHQVLSTTGSITYDNHDIYILGGFRKQLYYSTGVLDYIVLPVALRTEEYPEFYSTSLCDQISKTILHVEHWSTTYFFSITVKI